MLSRAQACRTSGLLAMAGDEQSALRWASMQAELGDQAAPGDPHWTQSATELVSQEPAVAGGASPLSVSPAVSRSMSPAALAEGAAASAPRHKGPCHWAMSSVAVLEQRSAEPVATEPLDPSLVAGAVAPAPPAQRPMSLGHGQW